ncbi:MAG: hypothetical protein A2Z03_00130 [Chloroflexi bacterium RBG_16_56_8]|nr:MAG: hypothetical protein A2Z03_00130 [Chloroflexi bacterium RBG_16_56_8]
MELEKRIEILEQEVKTLKSEIQQTLLEIRETLPQKPAATARWEKRAWILALLNILIAVALFTNIYFYLPGAFPFALDPTVVAWFRALWIALAFIWLLLQMYPLALLLEQEDRAWQGVVWRNASQFFRTRPTTIIFLTVGVLIVALVNTVVPAMWLVVALALLVAIGSIGVRSLIDIYREQTQAHGRG